MISLTNNIVEIEMDLKPLNKDTQCYTCKSFEQTVTGTSIGCHCRNKKHKNCVNFLLWQQSNGRQIVIEEVKDFG